MESPSVLCASRIEAHSQSFAKKKVLPTLYFSPTNFQPVNHRNRSYRKRATGRNCIYLAPVRASLVKFPWPSVLFSTISRDIERSNYRTRRDRLCTKVAVSSRETYPPFVPSTLRGTYFYGFAYHWREIKMSPTRVGLDWTITDMGRFILFSRKCWTQFWQAFMAALSRCTTIMAVRSLRDYAFRSVIVYSCSYETTLDVLVV